MDSTNTVLQRCCCPGQTNLPSSPSPTATTLSPLPTPHSVSSLCLSVCVLMHRQTCRCQDKAGAVSGASTHRPARRKPGVRASTVHSSPLSHAVNSQPSGFGSLSATGTGLLSPFAPSVPLGRRQRVLVLIWLVLGCHVALEPENQPTPPRG